MHTERLEYVMHMKFDGFYSESHCLGSFSTIVHPAVIAASAAFAAFPVLAAFAARRFFFHQSRRLVCCTNLVVLIISPLDSSAFADVRY